MAPDGDERANSPRAVSPDSEVVSLTWILTRFTFCSRGRHMAMTATDSVLSEDLYRDVRCGGFHPANAPLVHELVGTTVVGVLGEEPRWG